MVQARTIRSAGRHGNQIVFDRKRGGAIRYVGLPLQDLPEAIHEFVEMALIRTLKYWRRNFGPRHFMDAAYSAYGNREPNVYVKKVGAPEWMMDWFDLPDESAAGGPPMVSTGRMRDSFLRGSMSVTARSEEGKGPMVKAVWPNLPRYTYYFDPAAPANFRNASRNAYHPLRHNKPRMLTITNEEEQAKLKRVFEDELAQQTNQTGG